MLLDLDLSGFDPTLWDEPAPDDVCFLHLSDRIDCYAILDRQDLEWAKSVGLRQHRGLWSHTYGSGSIDPYTGTIQRPDGIYARKTVDGVTLYLHRIICLRAHGKPRDARMIADHRNGNTLDCRRRNLRWATRCQNAKNVKGTAIRTRFEREVQHVAPVGIGVSVRVGTFAQTAF